MMTSAVNATFQVASADYDASRNTWVLRNQNGGTVFEGDRVQVEERFGRILPPESREEFANEFRVGFSNALMIGGVAMLAMSLLLFAFIHVVYNS